MARRVLLLSWEYPPVVAGGLGRHVCALAEALAAAGDTVDVVTRGRDGDPASEIRGGLRVHRVAAPPMPHDLDAFLAWVDALNARMVAAGAALARPEATDVVHGHDWLVAAAAAALADRLRAPYLTTIHATEFGRHDGRVAQHPQAHVHAAETWMARRADGVIVCSDYMRDQVAEVFGLDGEAVTVIPNGVTRRPPAPARDLAALRAVHAAPDERLVLLSGRLVHEKGFQVALTALPAVVRRVGRVRFVVAGAGPHEAELRAQAGALGLDAHGEFLGWVGDEDLDALYRVADVCVVPSLYEPFGLVALEAMAAGCPCVVADTGGLREIVPDDAGVRVRPRDPRALAEALTLVLGNPAVRLRLGAAARAHAGTFAWADVARRTGAAYDAPARPRATGRQAAARR